MHGSYRWKLGFVLIAAALSGCAAEPQEIRWTRIDGPAHQYRLDGDWAACQGAARVQAGSLQRIDPGPRRGVGAAAAMAAYANEKNAADTYHLVLFGCMSDRGWIRSNR
jgi:hypothetical protein